MAGDGVVGAWRAGCWGAQGPWGWDPWYLVPGLDNMVYWLLIKVFQNAEISIFTIFTIFTLYQARIQEIF